MAADGVRFRKEVEHAEAVRKSVDMEDDMLQDVIEVARRALLQNELEKDVAREIKTYLDSKYERTWHVVVGRHFGSFVTHVCKHFAYFYLGSAGILVFKTADC